MTGRTDNNRSERQGGHREVFSAKEVRSKGATAGTRTGSEAAMRAMSVLANAKSNRRRKTHRVEPGGTGRKSMDLTRGGLPHESEGGVSRGHSSDETSRKAGRAKGRRTSRRRSTDRLREMGVELSETPEDSQLRRVPAEAGQAASGGLRWRHVTWTASPSSARKEETEDA